MILAPARTPLQMTRQAGIDYVNVIPLSAKRGPRPSFI